MNKQYWMSVQCPAATATPPWWAALSTGASPPATSWSPSSLTSTISTTLSFRGWTTNWALCEWLELGNIRTVHLRAFYNACTVREAITCAIVYLHENCRNWFGCLCRTKYFLISCDFCSLLTIVLTDRIHFVKIWPTICLLYMATATFEEK